MANFWESRWKDFELFKKTLLNWLILDIFSDVFERKPPFWYFFQDEEYGFYLDIHLVLLFGKFDKKLMVEKKLFKKSAILGYSFGFWAIFRGISCRRDTLSVFPEKFLYQSINVVKTKLHAKIQNILMDGFGKNPKSSIFSNCMWFHNSLF